MTEANAADSCRSSAVGRHYHNLHLHPHQHHHHVCLHHLHQLRLAPHHHHFCHHHHSAAASQPLPTASLMPNTNKDPTLHQSTADTPNEVLPQQEVVDEGEELDDDDPVFVMTDEWKEFFAKSEARRRLEKQQAKNKCKKKNKAG